MRKSEKKQQSQIQTIQRTVIPGESKITVIKKIPEKQSMVLLSMPGDVLLFLTTRAKKTAVWKTTFVSEHSTVHSPIPIDQVFCTRCMFCLLQSWRFQLTESARAICAKSAKHSRLPLSCVLSNMHTSALTQMLGCF